MVKFKKRVAKYKINRFFNTTPLVIFFHCVNQKDFYEILIKSLNHNWLSEKIKKEQQPFSKQVNIDIDKMRGLIALEGLTIKTVKNNFAKKALIENFGVEENLAFSILKNKKEGKAVLQHDSAFSKSEALKKLWISSISSESFKLNLMQEKKIDSFFKAKGGVPKKGEAVLEFSLLLEKFFKRKNERMLTKNLSQALQPFSSVKSKSATAFKMLDFKKACFASANEPRKALKKVSLSKKINKNSLLQGKNILMGFHNLNSLAKIKDFIEDKDVDILGAIYKNKVIDNNQIKRLASICQNQQIYVNLINCLKNSNHFFINQLSNKLDFSYLLFSQRNIIVLSKSLSCNK